MSALCIDRRTLAMPPTAITRDMNLPKATTDNSRVLADGPKVHIGLASPAYGLSDGVAILPPAAGLSHIRLPTRRGCASYSATSTWFVDFLGERCSRPSVPHDPLSLPILARAAAWATNRLGGLDGALPMLSFANVPVLFATFHGWGASKRTFLCLGMRRLGNSRPCTWSGSLCGSPFCEQTHGGNNCSCREHMARYDHVCSSIAKA